MRYKLATALAVAGALSVGVLLSHQTLANPSGAWFDVLEVKDDVGMVQSQLMNYLDSDPNLDPETKADRIQEAINFWAIYLNDGTGGQIHRRDWKKYGFPLWQWHDEYVLQDDALRPLQAAVYLDRTNYLRSYGT